jgi:FdhD protein
LALSEHSKSFAVLRCTSDRRQTDALDFIGEEPLLIRIEDNPYSVVMRTPGEELFHAAGFCLGEGIVDAPADFATVGHCKDLDPNVVDVRLNPERRQKVAGLLERRGFVSQTSCGICGKEMIEDLEQVLAPAADGFALHVDAAFACIAALSESQRYYPKTRGSHAALLFDDRLQAIAFAEDVGRHNALDKAVGNVFLNEQLKKVRIAVLSSRISYELVQKAARARVQVMLSKSRPTALAVEMGRRLNMTLAFPDGESDLAVACGEQRITGGQTP